MTNERKRLPDVRRSITHRVEIGSGQGEIDLYITAGYHDDGTLGEVFLSIGKQGSTLKGALDSFAIMLSMGLQFGVPLDSIVSKFEHVAFDPAGPTSNKEIPSCSSLVDYVAKWLDTHRTLDELP